MTGSISTKQIMNSTNSMTTKNEMLAKDIKEPLTTAKNGAKSSTLEKQLTITTQLPSRSNSFSLIGGISVVATIAIIIAYTVILLTGLIVYKKRMKKSSTVPIQTNSLQMSLGTNIYEEVNINSSHTTEINGARSTPIMSSSSMTEDEQRRQYDGDIEGIDSIIVTDYAVLSDKVVDKFQTNPISLSIMTPATKMNQEIESEYSLLREDTFNTVNITDMSIHRQIIQVPDKLSSTYASRSKHIK